jgi:hypothetical protein
MSQARRPLPASVYWRRRLVVFGGLLAVIAVIVLIIVRPGFGGEAPAQVDQAEVTEVEETPACVPSQIELVARTDKVTYEMAEVPQLWLEVTNISAGACELKVGTDIQRYVITSGSDQIWASDDCQRIKTPATIVLQPGETQGTEAIPWDRTRSTPQTCDSPSRPLMPGGGASYHLRVFLGEQSSEKTRQFLLN